jgi:hypothetical protein
MAVVAAAEWPRAALPRFVLQGDDAQPLREIRSTDVFGLFGLNQVNPRRGELSLCPGIISTGSELVLHLVTLTVASWNPHWRVAQTA